MIRTDADNQFDLMEEAAREVLGVMGEQKDNAYPGKLLTQLAPVEGDADDMFLPPLTGGEVHTIESILKTGNYGYAYFYKRATNLLQCFL